jgi:hypothetical protein
MNAKNKEKIIPARYVPTDPPPPGMILNKAVGAELAAIMIGIIIMNRKIMPKAKIFCRRNVRSGKR